MESLPPIPDRLTDASATFDEHEDLMRNAPQKAEGQVPFMAGGQTLSPLLPWYCGRPGAPMEIESAALLQVVREQLACRPFSLALDCHSGYGFDDSIWFPYAKTRR